MPYTVEKRNRMYRLIDPGGNIARTRTGAAMDGGGHPSRAKAQRQNRAIMAGESGAAKAHGRGRRSQGWVRG